MPIPGLKPQHEVRAKVRIGEKVEGTRRDGSSYERAASVDYFICPDAEFQQLYPGKPKTLRVLLPFATAGDNFSTGLERWDGAMLTCYSKGEGNPPIAYRKKQLKSKGKTLDLLDGFQQRGPEMGNERCPVTCLVRECGDLKAKLCKPMGRLQFWLADGDKTKGVLQLDTKSWNTVERIEAVLSTLGDTRGQVFLLSVQMETKGSKHFPVVTLTPEAAVEANTPAEVELADAYVVLRKHVEDDFEPNIRTALAAVLDLSHPGWRDNPAFIERIKEVGVKAAAEKMLEAVEL